MPSTFLALALIALQALPAFAAPQRNTTHPLLLLTNKPQSCLAVPVGLDLTIILDRREVERMAERKAPDGKPEQTRLAYIGSRRARLLLQATHEHEKKLGCPVVGTFWKRVLKHAVPEWLYVVFAIFDRGHGRVWNDRTNSFLTRAQRVDWDVHCRYGSAGEKTLETLEGYELISVPTCFREPGHPGLGVDY